MAPHTHVSQKKKITKKKKKNVPLLPPFDLDCLPSLSFANPPRGFEAVPLSTALPVEASETCFEEAHSEGRYRTTVRLLAPRRA